MIESISLREFGRRIDMSAEGVRKAIAHGRIPESCIGQFVLKTGRIRPCIIDPVAAAESLHRNTDQSQKRKHVKKTAAAKKQAIDIPSGKFEEPENIGDIPSITTSKAIRESFLAKMAEMDYLEKAGLLVNGEAVKVEITGMITAAKSRLLGVPAKARGRLAHLTVSDIETLEEMIAQALEELSDGS
jgi:hypothetical protein